MLEVSVMTIRRDLSAEPAAVVLLGGYVVTDPRSNGVTNYFVSDQKAKQVTEKRRIGLLAAPLINENDTVFFDCGTTTPAIIDAIADELTFTTQDLMQLARGQLEMRLVWHFIPAATLRGRLDRLVYGLTFVGDWDGMILCDPDRLTQALRNFCGDIVDRQLAAACLGNCALNNCTNGVLGKALSRGFYFWQLEQLIHAGNIPTGIGAGCRGGRGHCGIPPCARMAETDRNRTCQTEMLGLTGFEDRGAHQDTYASVCSPYTRIPRRQYTCHPHVH